MTVDLFHAIAHADSARVRRYVVDNQLEAHVRFRNVVYPEALADLKAHGGVDAVALWNGSTLVTGADAVIAALAALRPQ